MDIVAIIGVILAFSAILLGNALEGGQLAALLDAPAFIIVVGGTLGAVILQTPWLNLVRASRMFAWVVKPPELDIDKEIERLAAWSKTARREGLLGLENISQGLKDPFRRKGLELVVDGIDPHTIRRLMEVDSQARTDSDLAAANVFKSMGGYAPTIGILGAVIGLIQVLGNLADPNELGAGIATAFVATIYGVGFANLLFLPIADRLRTQVIRYAGADDLFIEGLIAIADGEHPRSVEMRLRGLVAGS
ncbi:MAG: flagellar motor protein [Pseudomonadaceae bacterium]|nr:flagellar motor protein [Pseudomonadaceae bacterium]